jgi:hypothetical protein
MLHALQSRIHTFWRPTCPPIHRSITLRLLSLAPGILSSLDARELDTCWKTHAEAGTRDGHVYLFHYLWHVANYPFSFHKRIHMKGEHCIILNESRVPGTGSSAVLHDDCNFISHRKEMQVLFSYLQ